MQKWNYSTQVTIKNNSRPYMNHMCTVNIFYYVLSGSSVIRSILIFTQPGMTVSLLILSGLQRTNMYEVKKPTKMSRLWVIKRTIIQDRFIILTPTTPLPSLLDSKKVLAGWTTNETNNKPTNWLTNQLPYWPTNQLTNKPTALLTNQPTTQTNVLTKKTNKTNQPMNRSSDQPPNQPNQWTKQKPTKPTNQWIDTVTNHPTNQKPTKPTDQWTDQLTNQPNQWTNKKTNKTNQPTNEQIKWLTNQPTKPMN